MSIEALRSEIERITKEISELKIKYRETGNQDEQIKQKIKALKDKHKKLKKDLDKLNLASIAEVLDTISKRDTAEPEAVQEKPKPGKAPSKNP